MGFVMVAVLLVSGMNVVYSDDSFIRSFGSYGSDDGQFQNPSKFVIGNNNNIYVPDGDERVQVFDNFGNFIFKFGSDTVSGMPLYNPGDIAVDGSGNIYVISTYWGMVFKFDSDGNFVRTITSYPNGSTSGQN